MTDPVFYTDVVCECGHRFERREILTEMNGFILHLAEKRTCPDCGRWHEVQRDG